MPQKDFLCSFLKGAALRCRQALPLFVFFLTGLAVLFVLAPVTVQMDLGQAHLDHFVHAFRRDSVDVFPLKLIVETKTLLSAVSLAKLAPLCISEVSLRVVVTGTAMDLLRIVRIHYEFPLILQTIRLGASVLRVGLDPATELLNLLRCVKSKIFIRRVPVMPLAPLH